MFNPDTRRDAAIVALNLGPSIVLKGQVTGHEDLVVAGRVEGSIELPDHVLTIAADAAVQAEIHAKVTIVMGSVIGDITATERVEVRERGSVQGNIVAPRLVLFDGGFISGQVLMPTAIAS